MYVFILIFCISAETIYQNAAHREVSIYSGALGHSNIRGISKMNRTKLSHPYFVICHL